MIGKGIAKGTWATFDTSYTHVSNFLFAEYKVDDINILSLDPEFIKKLYHWFRTVRNCNHNTSLKNITNMKKTVLSCVDNGWLLRDPFAEFETTRDETETVYLTKEEIQTIADKEIFNERLCRVRDLFIFRCYLILRVPLPFPIVLQFRGRVRKVQWFLMDRWGPSIQR